VFREGTHRRIERGQGFVVLMSEVGGEGGIRTRQDSLESVSYRFYNSGLAADARLAVAPCCPLHPIADLRVLTTQAHYSRALASAAGGFCDILTTLLLIQQPRQKPSDA